jgi:chromosome segregation ATPase
MARFFSLLVVCHLAVISACTLTKLQQESGQMESRIAQKEQDLSQLDSQKAALLAERKRLLSEIDGKQVTLGDLDSGLERLRRENARLKADNDRQRIEKQRVELEIRKFQGEIGRLDRDDRVPDKVKRERIESLKKEIKNYLEIMLTQ